MSSTAVEKKELDDLWEPEVFDLSQCYFGNKVGCIHSFQVEGVVDLEHGRCGVCHSVPPPPEYVEPLSVMLKDWKEGDDNVGNRYPPALANPQRLTVQIVANVQCGCQKW